MSAPVPSRRVLPTLNTDGTRRWIEPRLYPGPKWRARRVTAWALMTAFVALPWLRIGGKPVMLLDVVRREFTLFGKTFLATDGALLMLLMLAIFVAVVLVTAVAGRVWCGWACPQTVYMEFLYRPLERLFDGARGQKKAPGARRVAKYGVFSLVSVLLGNTFLAYFVGTDALLAWVGRSPFQHPEPFLVMAAVSALTLGDFAFFREQMCTVVCPYARLQSVLLDRRSLVVGYDVRRGEPRSQGKARAGSGDCIDCRACVKACPTGIDIRDGLQLECIACTQCADACDSIMERIRKPSGLIRYASQETLETGAGRASWLRPRVMTYAIILAGLVVALTALASTRKAAEVTILRGIGAPFELQDGLVTNQLRVKIQNRSDQERHFEMALLDAPGALLVAPEFPLSVAAGERRTTSVFVRIPPSSLVQGRRSIRLEITDELGFSEQLPYGLLGPAAGVAAGATKGAAP